MDWNIDRLSRTHSVVISYTINVTSYDSLRFSHVVDPALAGLEDADEPVLRTVSYKIKPELFKDDPRGRDVAIQELLDELSEFWRSTVRGFNFFGIQYKKEHETVALSMVFKNKFYLSEYKKSSLVEILKRYKGSLASDNVKGWQEAGNRFGIMARDETIVQLSTSTTSSPNLDEVATRNLDKITSVLEIDEEK